MSQNAEPVEKEMKELTASYEADKLEFIKNPVVAEFLGLSSNTDFTESELEQRIITHVQKFLMELGKGYAFVARQQHIRTEKEDYYIDLVFYNYILKCFVLIDVVGGGGCMIQNFGEYDKNRVTIVWDICATAKGYEAMTVRKIQRNGGMLV